MASFKKIPIVQVTKFDKSKLFEYICDKYTFTPITKDTIENALSERIMLNDITATNEDVEEQIEQSKAFLSDLLKKYHFYLKDSTT